MESRISIISCSSSSSCFVSTALAMLADFSQFSSAYFNSTSRSTSPSNSRSRQLRPFSNQPLTRHTSSSMILTRQVWMLSTSAPSLMVYSSSMCLIMASRSSSYRSFSLRYFSSRFSSLRISCWLHRASSYSKLRLSRYYPRWLFNFLTCAESTSASCLAAESSFVRVSSLCCSRQGLSIFMEAAERLRGGSQAGGSCLKSSSVSISRAVFSGLCGGGVSRKGNEAMSSSEPKLSFLREPERQASVWTELRLTKRREFSVCVGKDPLLSFFFALIGLYFISRRFIRLIQFYLIKLMTKTQRQHPSALRVTTG